MSALLDKQCRLAVSMALLIQHAASLGYRIKIGETLRSDEQAEINALGFSGREALAQLIEHAFPLLAKKIRNNTGNGIRGSLHGIGLAFDYQLFDSDGNWLKEPIHYERLAEFWEKIAPDHRAGIRFGDTPHLSIEHEGVK